MTLHMERGGDGPPPVSPHWRHRWLQWGFSFTVACCSVYWLFQGQWLLGWVTALLAGVTAMSPFTHQYVMESGYEIGRIVHDHEVMAVGSELERARWVIHIQTYMGPNQVGVVNDTLAQIIKDATEEDE